MRKCDSQSHTNEMVVFSNRADRSWAVIKLKQVEHIRNERSALAGVAGHPFITTLVTSFADRECLYMLVLVHAYTLALKMLTSLA